MKLKPPRHTAVIGLLLFGLALRSSVTDAFSQDVGQTASGLIRYLTTRPGAATFSCGEILARNREERTAAASLASLGASAVPALVAALDSVEGLGIQSPFARGSGWLVLVYARIEGPTGLARLYKMARNPLLGFMSIDLDQAISLSAGLTSYTSGQRAPVRLLTCRRDEPRHALDQVVLAWVKDDPDLLKAKLGPKATAALDLLLKGRTWADLRADLWTENFDQLIGVGYRFGTSGRWVEPEETLDEELERQRNPAVVDPPDPELETSFVNAAGAACGTERVKFNNRTDPNQRYLVDNEDLAKLLRLIASCATGA